MFELVRDKGRSLVNLGRFKVPQQKVSLQDIKRLSGPNSSIVNSFNNSARHVSSIHVRALVFAGVKIEQVSLDIQFPVLQTGNPGVKIPYIVRGVIGIRLSTAAGGMFSILVSIRF